MCMYAQETQHEKIVRGLAIGIALVMYGRMEEADVQIETLLADKVSNTGLSSLELLCTSFIFIEPSQDFMSPASILIKVDFPLPFGPSKPNIEFVGISNDIPSRALILSKRLETF